MEGLTSDGVSLMLLGMGTVFVFLSVLVFAHFDVKTDNGIVENSDCVRAN